MTNTSKHPSTPPRDTATCTPGCNLPRDLNWHCPHTAQHLFYHGEPSPLLEHLTHNDVANLQRGGHIGGGDVPQFLAQIAIAPFRAPTGRTSHYLRHPLYLISDCGTRYDADGRACDSERFLVCDSRK